MASVISMNVASISTIRITHEVNVLHFNLKPQILHLLLQLHADAVADAGFYEGDELHNFVRRCCAFVDENYRGRR